mgnify:CR=1 FL=1
MIVPREIVKGSRSRRVLFVIVILIVIGLSILEDDHVVPVDDFRLGLVAQDAFDFP